MRCTARLAATAVAVTLSCSVASAGTVLVEDLFDAPDGALVGGSGGATSFGFAGGYVSNSGAFDSISADIVSGALQVRDLPSGPSSGERFGRLLATAVDGADGDVVYVGVDFQAVGGPNSAVEFLRAGDPDIFSIGADTNDGANFGFNLKDDADGTLPAGVGDIGIGTAIETDLNTYIVRIDFDSTGDTATLYVNPTSGDEGAQTAVGSVGGPTTGVDLSFDQFGFFNFSNSAGANVDNLRIATSFDSAIGIPEPSTVLLLGLSLCGVSRMRRK